VFGNTALKHRPNTQNNNSNNNNNSSNDLYRASQVQSEPIVRADTVPVPPQDAVFQTWWMMGAFKFKSLSSDLPMTESLTTDNMQVASHSSLGLYLFLLLLAFS
jgi:hypothetical protein